MESKPIWRQYYVELLEQDLKYLERLRKKMNFISPDNGEKIHQRYLVYQEMTRIKKFITLNQEHIAKIDSGDLDF